MGRKTVVEMKRPATPPPAAAPAKASAPASEKIPKEKKAKVVATVETVKRACGHEQTMRFFPNDKVNEIDQRRTRLTITRCRPCGGSDRPGIKDEVFYRLPHGTLFSATYDDVEKKWHGCVVSGQLSIDGVEVGIHALMRSLGRKLYEAVMAAKAGSSA